MVQQYTLTYFTLLLYDMHFPLPGAWCCGLHSYIFKDGSERIKPFDVGTTSATVLTRAILVEGCKSVAAGMNPMDLRRGINIAVEHVVNELKNNAKPISTAEEIAQV